MPKKKADVAFGYRAYEELDRIYELGKYGRAKSEIKTLGCNRKTIYEWKAGTAPDAMYLARLHQMGADIIYILTGARRTDGQSKDVGHE